MSEVRSCKQKAACLPSVLLIFDRYHMIFHMSEKCLKCFRSIQSCLCWDILPVDPGIKFVYLMHPKEAYKQKTGTGRLASISLVNSEIIIDATFDNNSRTQELISDSAYYPMILYPEKGAHSAESFNFNASIDGKTLLVFLIDATWIMARKMMNRSHTLQNLPKISFSSKYRSCFLIKKQPADHCLSTIESSYFLIKELQKSGVCDPSVKIDGLMSIFDRMIQYQLDCKERKPSVRYRKTAKTC